MLEFSWPRSTVIVVVLMCVDCVLCVIRLSTNEIVYNYAKRSKLVPFHSGSVERKLQPRTTYHGNSSGPVIRPEDQDAYYGDLVGDLSKAIREIVKAKDAKQDGDSDVLQLIRSRNVQLRLLSRARRVTLRSANSTHPTDAILPCSAPTTHPPRPLVIPNVVHYVWFKADRNFTFLHYLSMRSVQLHIVPDYVLLHGDALPRNGFWWRRALSEVDNLYFVSGARPLQAPNGARLRYIEHASDIARFCVVQEYGGIYMDSDVLVLKSFDDLRRYPMVLGRETDQQLANGIIIAQRGHPFLSVWLEAYRNYHGEQEVWAEISTQLPHKLAAIFPHLVHVEQSSLFRPNWQEAEVRQMFLGHYNWTCNYAVHIYKVNIPAGAKVPTGPSDVDQLNSTLGEISRFLLYGSKDLRPAEQPKG